jgi:hypothetical protein
LRFFHNNLKLLKVSRRGGIVRSSWRRLLHCSSRLEAATAATNHANSFQTLISGHRETIWWNRFGLNLRTKRVPITSLLLVLLNPRIMLKIFRWFFCLKWTDWILFSILEFKIVWKKFSAETDSQYRLLILKARVLTYLWSTI